MLTRRTDVDGGGGELRPVHDLSSLGGKDYFCDTRMGKISIKKKHE